MKMARWLERLGTETAFEVLSRARALEAAGKKVVHLEIGEPDFQTPRNIREAAKRALDAGYTHYGPSAGLPDHQAAIAEEAGKRRGIAVDPEEVVVTPGAKPIIFFGLMACVDPGDEVIYPNPGFPIYESMINFLGAKAVPIPLREDLDFRLDVAELERLVTPKTKMIIINSPQNPTGSVLDTDDLERIAAVAASRDLWVLSDEIYSRILYEGNPGSIAVWPGMKERTIILDGYSKAYAMTGWRAGYGIMPKSLAVQVARLQTNATSCTASFTQVACMEALRGPQDEVDRMVAEFRRRRDCIVAGLNHLPGVRCRTPRGAFYVFPNITGTGRASRDLADSFLKEAGVACLSGTAFGSGGEGYLRFSYANSVENIEWALGRMKTMLEKSAVAAR